MRQFVAEEGLDKNGCLLVSGKKARHLVSVLRVAPGDMVYVRLPGGVLQQMTVGKIDSGKKSVLLQAAGDTAPLPDASGEPGASLLSSASSATHAAPLSAALAHEAPELWLFVFVSKPPKMDLIIRQAVECGVSRIVPVYGEFCQAEPVQSARKKCGTNPEDSRWQRLISEAREQSGSAVETCVLDVVTLEQALELWQKSGGGLGVVLYEQTAGTVCMHSAASSCDDVRQAAVFVGAEGGISPQEIDFLQKGGIVPVHFATNILRCETAALYGIAALQSALMEKKIWQLKE